MVHSLLTPIRFVYDLEGANALDVPALLVKDVNQAVYDLALHSGDLSWKVSDGKGGFTAVSGILALDNDRIEASILLNTTNISALDDRLVALKILVDANTAEILAIETNTTTITGVQRLLTDLTAIVTTNTANILAHTTEFSALDLRIESITESIQTNTTGIATNLVSIGLINTLTSSHTTQINTNISGITALGERIDALPDPLTLAQQNAIADLSLIEEKVRPIILNTHSSYRSTNDLAMIILNGIPANPVLTGGSELYRTNLLVNRVRHSYVVVRSAIRDLHLYRVIFTTGIGEVYGTHSGIQYRTSAGGFHYFVLGSASDSYAQYRLSSGTRITAQKQLEAIDHTWIGDLNKDKVLKAIGDLGDVGIRPTNIFYGDHALTPAKLDDWILSTDKKLYRGVVGEGAGTVIWQEYASFVHPDNLTSVEIKDSLETLKGNARLDSTAVKNLPVPIPQLTSAQVRDRLTSLQGTARLPAIAIRDLPVSLTLEQENALQDLSVIEEKVRPIQIDTHSVFENSSELGVAIFDDIPLNDVLTAETQYGTPLRVRGLRHSFVAIRSAIRDLHLYRVAFEDDSGFIYGTHSSIVYRTSVGGSHYFVLGGASDSYARYRLSAGTLIRVQKQTQSVIDHTWLGALTTARVESALGDLADRGIRPTNIFYGNHSQTDPKLNDFILSTDKKLYRGVAGQSNSIVWEEYASFIHPTSSQLTATQVRNRLTSLSGSNRLPASAIRDLPSGGGGSAAQLTATQVRDRLESLSGVQRLPYTSIANTPTIPVVTGVSVRNLLNTLRGNSRLSATAIRDLPSGGGTSDTATQIKTKLETLEDEARLSATAIKDLPTVINTSALTEREQTVLDHIEYTEVETLPALEKVVDNPLDVPFEGVYHGLFNEVISSRVGNLFPNSGRVKTQPANNVKFHYDAASNVNLFKPELGSYILTSLAINNPSSSNDYQVPRLHFNLLFGFKFSLTNHAVGSDVLILGYSNEALVKFSPQEGLYLQIQRGTSSSSRTVNHNLQVSNSTVSIPVTSINLLGEQLINIPADIPVSNNASTVQIEVRLYNNDNDAGTVTQAYTRNFTQRSARVTVNFAFPSQGATFSALISYDQFTRQIRIIENLRNAALSYHIRAYYTTTETVSHGGDYARYPINPGHGHDAEGIFNPDLLLRSPTKVVLTTYPRDATSNPVIGVKVSVGNNAGHRYYDVDTKRVASDIFYSTANPITRTTAVYGRNLIGSIGSRSMGVKDINIYAPLVNTNINKNTLESLFNATGDFLGLYTFASHTVDTMNILANSLTVNGSALGGGISNKLLHSVTLGRQDLSIPTSTTQTTRPVLNHVFTTTGASSGRTHTMIPLRFNKDIEGFNVLGDNTKYNSTTGVLTLPAGRKFYISFVYFLYDVANTTSQRIIPSAVIKQGGKPVFADTQWIRGIGQTAAIRRSPQAITGCGGIIDTTGDPITFELQIQSNASLQYYIQGASVQMAELLV